MKLSNKFDLISIVSMAVTVLGAILVASHVLIAGLVVAGVGMLAAIVGYILKGKLNMNVNWAYIALTVTIILFIFTAIGFAGYTTWDIYKAHDFG